MISTNSNGRATHEEYIGWTSKDKMLFLFEPNKFKVLPCRKLLRECKVQPVLDTPFPPELVRLPSIPKVVAYLYDVKYHLRVVSGFVLSNGHKECVDLYHLGEGWTTHVQFD